MKDGYQRIRAVVNLDNARQNMESMHRNLKPGTMMAAVIKADAYGCGAVQIARAIDDLPYLWGYCTATFEEAQILRMNGIQKPILLLGYVFPYCYEKLATENIRPAVFREDMIKELGAAAERVGKKARIFIAVDTGMTRIGVTPDDHGLQMVARAAKEPGIEIEGIFTHFARADEKDKSSARNQLMAFTSFTDRIENELGVKIPVKTASNSAGIVEMPEANLDMVRAGITLYGLWPSPDVSKDIVPLKPVLSLLSSIVYIKTVPAGKAVSYGGTFITKGETRIATISAGYDDGYPRDLPGKDFSVLIRGKRAPILGRICMDQFMVDVTDIPDATEGDDVTLIGTDGEETITMEDAGDVSGRFNYELECCINKRVPRIYIRNGEISGYEDHFGKDA
ncbi:MAG: alanine racemase [Clostridiales bacterium]|nr:alanine racemase [Clostridiales bacterium]